MSRCWFKRVLDRGPEQRESNLTVLCPLIIIILISYIIIYYIIIKLLIMENHPSRNRKRNSQWVIVLKVMAPNFLSIFPQKNLGHLCRVRVGLHVRLKRPIFVSSLNLGSKQLETQLHSTVRGKYHCTVDLLFDWFGSVCFENKNKNCQLSYS
jgi:hypothetical protein